MCGLGHLFEQQGIPTTVISLVRLHAEKMTPPRALWVPFELGRPFGPPNDASFQRRVVEQALGLLESHEASQLEDFPDDDPSAAGGENQWVCPVNFARVEAQLSGAAAVRQSLLDEIAAMQPWYTRALETKARTTLSENFGSIEERAEFLSRMFEDELPESPDAGISLEDAVRLRAEDLKAFMYESAAAQPGNPSGRELDEWFWSETKTAETMHRLREICIAQGTPAMQTLGFLLVPMAHQRELGGAAG